MLLDWLSFNNNFTVEILLVKLFLGHLYEDIVVYLWWFLWWVEILLLLLDNIFLDKLFSLFRSIILNNLCSLCPYITTTIWVHSNFLVMGKSVLREVLIILHQQIFLKSNLTWICSLTIVALWIIIVDWACIIMSLVLLLLMLISYGCNVPSSTGRIDAVTGATIAWAKSRWLGHRAGKRTSYALGSYRWQLLSLWVVVRRDLGKLVCHVAIGVPHAELVIIRDWWLITSHWQWFSICFPMMLAHSS